MTGSLSLQDARYRSAEKVNALFERTLEKMAEVPGVEHAAVALTLPYERALNIGSRWIGDAKPGAEAIATMNQTYVSPGYFEALRIPLVRGRVFTPADAANAEPVIVVNEAFVRRSSRDADPIGRRMGSARSARTIIGVVGDIQQKAGWGNFGPVAAMPATYIPVAQVDDAYVAMVHTWFSPELVRPDRRAASGHRRRDADRGAGRPIRSCRSRNSGQSMMCAVKPWRNSAHRRCCSDRWPDSPSASRQSASTAWSPTASPSAGASSASGSRWATSRQAIAFRGCAGLLSPLSAWSLVVGGARRRDDVAPSGVGSVGDGPATFAVAGRHRACRGVVATLVPALRMVRLNPISALRS
jgi:hypothetical protein